MEKNIGHRNHRYSMNLGCANYLFKLDYYKQLNKSKVTREYERD